MFIVFAGAGASKAVDPSQFPSTVEFFDRLPPDISKSEMFTLVSAMLGGRRGGDRVIDIEQVLWALGELRNFLLQVGDTSTVPGWFLHGARLLKPISLTTDFGNLIQNAPRVLEVVQNLIDAINVQIYNWYSKEPDAALLESNWLALLRPLLRSGERVEVFTTNYDLVIEVAADKLAREGLPEISTGRKGAIQRYLDESEWVRPPRDPKLPEGPGGLLTKLHGSVDFARGPERIFVGDPLFKGSHDRHVILYPGFKGVPDREPFVLFHNHFARALAQSVRLLFVGFAFRDEHINGLIERYTLPRAAVAIINPVDEIPGLPLPKERVKHIKGYFDEPHIVEALQDLGISPAA